MFALFILKYNEVYSIYKEVPAKIDQNLPTISNEDKFA